MKLDPYKLQNRWDNWIEEVEKTGIIGISKVNSDVIIQFVQDMKNGENVSRKSKKGSRGYHRLITLKNKLPFIAKLLERRGIKDMTKLKEKEIMSLFNGMRDGNIRKKDGGKYTSVGDYVEVFVTFWHWWILVNKKKKKTIEINDITEALDRSGKENDFVYITFDELKKMLPYFSQDEQVRLLFMFDTIMRSPTELMNQKLSDITPDFKETQIRDETSKTYGRRIKILLCSKELKAYVERNNISQDDYLFKFSPPLFNKKLKKVAVQVLGRGITKGGKPYSSISMYDLRHSGTIYWRLGAYRKKIDALMYRGGWSSLEMLNYYTKKIGMKDSIEQEDLMIGMDKTEMENRIEAQEKELQRMKKIITRLNVVEKEEGFEVFIPMRRH